MKSEKGITLVSLIIYILVMIIVIALMSQIINNFYANTQAVNASTEEILEFNKFNTYFIREIKTKGNVLDSINNTSILFTSGNIFTFNSNDEAIYYNDIKICSKVINFVATLPDENDRTVINIKIYFENYNNEINYKIEDLY